MTFRRLVSNYLTRRSIRLHRSRIGWRAAPRYTRYLKRCQDQAPVAVQAAPAVAKAAAEFRDVGIASFWTERTEHVANAVAANIAAREAAGENIWSNGEDMVGNYRGDAWRDFPAFAELFAGDLGDFLKLYYGSHFKILYGTLYRSVNAGARQASQLWHSDSGPGICVNVMFYLHQTTPQHGTLEALDWQSSLEIYDREKVAEFRGELDRYEGTRRDRICAFYDEVIGKGYRDRIRRPCGPAGLVVPFLNNVLHRGGYPDPGHMRTAIVFHCYPSHRATDLERYGRLGITKTVPYPQDPAAEF